MSVKNMSKSIFSILFVVLLLAGCSNNPSVEIISATVEIEKNNLVEDSDELEFVNLHYNFVLKNVGRKDLGGDKRLNDATYDYDDGIKIYIEPSEKLKAISEELIGINIYDKEKNYGTGHTGLPVLKPNQEGEFSLDFVLGALKDNEQLKAAPSSEQLEKLKENAMDATLMVMVEDETIAQFDLNNLE